MSQRVSDKFSLLEILVSTEHSGKIMRKIQKGEGGYRIRNSCSRSGKFQHALRD